MASADKFNKIPFAMEQELTSLKDLAPVPEKERVYRFLQAVYKLYRRWRPDSKSMTIIVELHKKLLPASPKSVPNFIIRLGASQVKPRQRYKYANALELAYWRNVKERELVSFIKKQGGINCCAKQNPRERRERQKRERDRNERIQKAA